MFDFQQHFQRFSLGFSCEFLKTMVRKHQKLQLSQGTGKPKTLPKPTQMPSTSVDNVFDSNPNSEIAQKFELELCWCIQQLQIGLKNGKLNPKQNEEYRKILNTLMSSSAPVVKKRQVMRCTFGDYRAKMLSEEKKFKSQAESNRIKVQPVTPNKNSVFIKKSIFATNGKDFKFNFDVAQDKELPDVSTITINDKTDKGLTSLTKDDNIVQTTDFSFVPSNNLFKFNFTEAM